MDWIQLDFILSTFHICGGWILLRKMPNHLPSLRMVVFCFTSPYYLSSISLTGDKSGALATSPYQKTHFTSIFLIYTQWNPVAQLCTHWIKLAATKSCFSINKSSNSMPGWVSNVNIVCVLKNLPSLGFCVRHSCRAFSLFQAICYQGCAIRHSALNRHCELDWQRVWNQGIVTSLALMYAGRWKCSRSCQYFQHIRWH